MVKKILLSWLLLSLLYLRPNKVSAVLVDPGDIIINEVMWMGSRSSSLDEWIELKNLTSNPINLEGWIIENGASAGGEITIPVGYLIPANGYFLIGNYSENDSSSSLNVVVDLVNSRLSLANSNNGHLILKDNTDKVIDQAKGDSWPAGVDGTLKQSMQRNSIPGDGLLGQNWHTCIDNECTGTIYWDSEGGNFGTPKGPLANPEARYFIPQKPFVPFFPYRPSQPSKPFRPFRPTAP